jgi:hypothetical protein
MQLGSMLRGEGHVGEHVMLGLVHQPAEFLEPGPQLIGGRLSHEPELATRSPKVPAGVMQPSQLAMSGTPRRGGRGGCGER